jgi:hypothetical protein
MYESFSGSGNPGSLEKSMYILKEMSQDVNSKFLAATTKFSRLPFLNNKRRLPNRDPIYSKEELQFIYLK